ncbi:hypothetical protein LXL04_030536 [Taraxacum kok-saghyz]
MFAPMWDTLTIPTVEEEILTEEGLTEVPISMDTFDEGATVMDLRDCGYTEAEISNFFNEHEEGGDDSMEDDEKGIDETQPRIIKNKLKKRLDGAGCDSETPLDIN